MQHRPTSSIQVSFLFGDHCHEVTWLSGEESVSAPYEFCFCFKTRDALEAEAIIGFSARLHFVDTASDTFRKIPGIITQYRIVTTLPEGFYIIEATLCAHLKKLQYSGTPRVFVERTSIEICQYLFEQHGLRQWMTFAKHPDEPIPVYPHCVQAEDEDDLTFMQRILAHDGIHYCWIEDLHQHLWLSASGVQSPDTSPLHLQWHSDTGLSHTDAFGVFELSKLEEFASYSVHYRDFDEQQPDRVLTADYGNGKRPVEVWGFGARSAEHLQRAARIHYERLMMNAELYEATTGQLQCRAGHAVNVTVEPLWTGVRPFRFLKVSHHFSDGRYHNRITLLPKATPIRPAKVIRAAGQTVHTATIVSQSDTPYLDEQGRYTFTSHIHEPIGARNGEQHAARLTPYGGKALNQAMGMHFPLRRQAEVLVMYLHNDFNQPILQNSPSNRLNQPPVTQDNSWDNLIKTAWGQYLLFCDRHGFEGITLANADGQNKLALNAHAAGHHVELSCLGGSIHGTAEKTLLFKTQDYLKLHVGKNFILNTEKSASYQAHGIHLQSQTQTIKAGRHLKLDAERNIECSGQSMTLQSQGNLTIKADGKLIRLDATKGDIVVEAKHIDIEALSSIKLQTEGTILEMNATGIQMQAANIAFNTPNLELGALLGESPIPPLPLTTFQEPKALCQVPYYDQQAIKTIQPPNWDCPFHRLSETAHIEVSIAGFKGTEQGRLSIVRSDADPIKQALPQHPKLSELNEAVLVTEQTFTLGNAALYPDAEDIQNPGTAQLRIPVSLKDFNTSSPTPKAPYYAQLEIGDMRSEVYSGPMLLLARAKINIKGDKEEAYHMPDSIVALTRALPPAVLQSSHCPLQQEARYYNKNLFFDELPMGGDNQVRLKEANLYRELLDQDYKTPFPIQKIAIEKDDDEATITRLMPPIIFDLCQAQMDDNGQISFKTDNPEARDSLTPEEVAYFNANGNNVVVFIHGYNVPSGAFCHYIESLSHEAIQTHYPAQAGFPVSRIKRIYKTNDYDCAPATVYRDENTLAKQLPDYDASELRKGGFNAETLNGTGARNWVIQLEHELNCAAGFDGKDYQPYTRCLFINWPGNPDNELDYYSAIHESIRMGPMVAKILQNIAQQLSKPKINIIAHSLGNSVLVHALNILGQQNTDYIEQAFLWQAAIPNNALSDHGWYTEGQPKPTPEKIAQDPKNNLWYCPHAHRAAQKFTVLYSKNDNILGSLLAKDEQSKETDAQAVWQRKPKKDELMPALGVIMLNLESIYQVASWVGLPVSHLFDEHEVENAWARFRTLHPTFYSQKHKQTFACQETLDAQATLLQSLEIDGLLNDDLINQLYLGVCRAHHIINSIYPLIKYVELASILGIKFLARTTPLGRFLFTIVKVFKQASKNQTTLPGTLSPTLKTNLEKTIRNFVENRFHPSPGLVTFLQTTILNNEVLERPAMGYEGVDMKDKKMMEMEQKDKLNNVETTKWLWHHSDMKMPSEDIREKIYKAHIMNKRKGLQKFGKYKIDNN